MRKRFQIDAVYVAHRPNRSFWLDRPWYSHGYSLDRGGRPNEQAMVRFAWNEEGLFVHAELEDSFVVAHDPRDEQLHFQTGDVFELFVKPLDDDYYWEMYVTPFGNKSTLFFPRERTGMEVENILRDHSFHGLNVSAGIIDGGWVANMFVPVQQLTALGAVWGEGCEWSLLCGRYNYNSDALEDPELSMLPPVSKTNYHLTEEYAGLRLLPSGRKS
ncbi:MAG: hypothetical protein V5783_00405 [Pontiella sp.]